MQNLPIFLVNFLVLTFIDSADASVEIWTCWIDAISHKLAL